MALQAFIDDSMTAGRVLVMAGYIGRADSWSSFSDQWREALTMSPRLERFKMNEVDMESDRQRERVEYLYRIIEDHVQAQVAVAVNCRELSDLVSRMLVNPILANPYYLAHKAVVNLTGQLQGEIGISDPIDFIFDRRIGEEKTVSVGFAHYMESLPEEFLGTIKKLPIFRDDLDFIPLQAADFLAWWVRRWWLQNNGRLGNHCVGYPWDVRWQIPSLVLDLAGDELRRELEAIESAEQANRVADLLRRRAQWPMSLKVNFSCDPSLKKKGET